MPFRVTETSRASAGSGDPGDALARRGRLGGHLQLDDLEPFAPELEEPHHAVLGHLVLDEREQAGRRAHRLGDPEQVEVLLVARVVDARDRLRHAVPLLRDLRDDEVVLVVAGDREHELRRARDAGPLEDVDLGRIARERHRAELGLELLEPVAALLHERHLVAHPEERAGDARPDLAATGDDRVHQASVATGVGSHERAMSVSVAIAVCVGQTVRRPRSA